MHSLAVRPQLLRSLPELPGATASVLSHLELHQLLREDTPDAASSITAFWERIQQLAASPSEESRLAAARLLTAFCADTSLLRFAAAAEAATASLLSLLRPVEPPRVRAAAVAAAAAFVRRCSAGQAAVPSLRRDASSLLTKALPPLLAALRTAEPPCSPELRQPTLQLCAAAARGACAGALRSCAAPLEHVLSTSLLLPGCGAASTAALAALPRLLGDAAAWSGFARRVLLQAHDALDAALQGCEPAGAAETFRGALAAPGEPAARRFDEPPAERGQASASRRACAWLGVASALLETPFPVAVPLPASCVLLLCQRVLMTDGASDAPQSLLLSLPSLHIAALALLSALYRSAGVGGCLAVSQPMAQLLAASLSSGAPGAQAGPTCGPLRAAVYAAAAEHCRSLGASFALDLAPAIVHAARNDLAVLRLGGAALPPAAGGGKKRKKGDAASAEPTGAAAADDASRVGGAEAAAGAASRIACLDCLAALLACAGGLLPEPLRADVDFLVAAAAEGALDAVERINSGIESLCELLSAIACLLASLHAPRPRAPHCGPEPR